MRMSAMISRSHSLMLFAVIALLWSVAANAEGDPGPLPTAVAEVLEKQDAKLASGLNMLWVLISAALVFFMQAGFLGVEVGCVRPKNVIVTAVKNCGDWMMVTIVFFFVGFGLMFGPDLGGLVGWGNFMDDIPADGGGGLGWTFVFFQVAFAGTAATIVSGAMAERTKLSAYLIFAVCIGGAIYPVYGHWAWGNLFHPNATPLLASLGYIDFAGSSVVHLTGAVAAFVGVVMVGPRLGLYRSDGTRTKMNPAGLGWTCLGVLILWLGWFGFNGGSTLVLNGDVAAIIVNTNLAGAASGIGAFIHARYFSPENIVEKSLGGALGGLVAITANCHIVSPLSAIMIGLIAAVLHNLSYELILNRWKLDDVIGAIPVHGVCGIWGVLAVALFGKSELLPKPWVEQFFIQVVGIGACIIWVGFTSVVVLTLLKLTIGLRVSPMKEIQGLGAYEKDEDDVEEEAPRAAA